MSPKKPSYHDYVIRDGQFIGRFEEMYRDVADPWSCSGNVDSLQIRVLLEVLREGRRATVLDVGCGLGSLSRRIFDELRPERMHACDISPTAVAAAARNNPGPSYFVHDVLKSPRLPFPSEAFQLILVAEVIWYVLPVLDELFLEFARLVTGDGALVLKQAFYPPGVQRYGTETVSEPGDIVKRLIPTKLQPRIQITTLAEDGSRSWICRATPGRSAGSS